MKALQSGLAYLAIFAAWVLHWLPVRVLSALGAAVGALLYRADRSHRRVANINLELCFPALDDEQRARLVKEHFRVWGRAFLEEPVLWWGSAKRIKRWVQLEGMEHWRAARDRPIILLAPHFAGLDAGGIRIAMEAPLVSSYRTLKNRVADRFVLKSRRRFGPTLMFARRDGVRPIVKALREGRQFYYLPDQDFGARDAVFVPFFGVQTATVTALARLAEIAKARVVPIVTRQTEQGYVARCYPAWENFPTDDIVADTRRMNEFIEARAREMPAQYLWTHRRFKTRPPGEPSPYNRPAQRAQSA